MNIIDFFNKYNKVALCFSGGVDSSYLLYVAKSMGVDVMPYYVKSVFQPQFELDDAIRLTTQLNVDIRVIDVDILSIKAVVCNPANRCYYCKDNILEAIISEANVEGYDIIIDGTNATDDSGDRPGMKALIEKKVLSPLKMCGISKEEIRNLSKEVGLFTWNKPAYACLATRIPQGKAITGELLSKVEMAEKILHDIGFHDFRVRIIEDGCRIQVVEEELELLLSIREVLLVRLRDLFYNIDLDLKTR